MAAGSTLPLAPLILSELARIPDMSGSCALHVAAEEGNAGAARLLVAALRPEDVNQRNLNLNEYSQGGPGWSASWPGLAVTAGRPACLQGGLLAPADWLHGLRPAPARRTQLPGGAPRVSP